MAADQKKPGAVAAESAFQLQVSVTVTPPPDTYGVYSNMMSVRATESDFVLDFGQILPPSNDEDVEKVRRTGQLTIPSKARIVVPISVMPRVVAALRQVLNEFAEKKGLKLPETEGE